MKKLIVNDEQFQAEKIVKNDTDIIGYDLQGNEVFSFKGIFDFTLFTLEDGQSWDISDEEKKNQRLSDLELAIAEILGGGL